MLNKCTKMRKITAVLVDIWYNGNVGLTGDM